MKTIDNFLNRITMYRLVLYYLGGLVVIAMALGLVGILPYTPIAILNSTIIILSVSWVANIVFARVFEAATNVESVPITALILVLIMTPVATLEGSGVALLALVSVWSIAAKYLFAIGKKHIFNPAAFGVAFSAIVFSQSATWWVGNPSMAVFVLMGGLLIVRKIRRFDLVGSFAIVAIVTSIATATSHNTGMILNQTFFHTSFLFLGLVMLTEPLTTPPTRALRMLYGALVGMLFAPNVHFGDIYLTPELALLAGNIFSYAVSPKGRFMLALDRVEEAAAGVYDFVFKSDRRFSFDAGQYLEWTLEHRKPDDRGNRRYFTIASSPLQEEVRLGVKFYDPPSSFKRALAALRVGDIMSVSQLAGDFTLPKDSKKKLAFIAGGIGVTPFRSMAEYLIDRREVRPITMLYANKTTAEIAYKTLFDRARDVTGMKTVYMVTGGEAASAPDMRAGMIDQNVIAAEIPDYRERIFYLSGPHGMVESYKKVLRQMGVPRRRIKADYFPGFA